MNKKQQLEYRKDLQYTEKIKNAVRYGFLYRIEAEENPSVHACLDDASDVLLWLANVVIGGFVWDVIKSALRKVARKIKKDKTLLDKKTQSVLTDENQLNKFILYVREFHERRISVNDKQFRYIKEEIVANYFGEEVARIHQQENRLPTDQEYAKIQKEANLWANDVIGHDGVVI